MSPTSYQPLFLWLTPNAPHSIAVKQRGRSEGGPAFPPPRYRHNRFSNAPIPRHPNFDEADVSDKPSIIKAFPRVTGAYLKRAVDNWRGRLGALLGVGEGRGLLALVGVLSLIAGLVLVKRPNETLVLLTLIVGIWFVVAGIARLVSAFALPEGRGLTILIAVIDLAAGIVILAWPKLGISTFAVILGIFLILRGALFIASGWSLRGVDRELAATG